MTHGTSTHSALGPHAFQRILSFSLGFMFALGRIPSRVPADPLRATLQLDCPHSSGSCPSGVPLPQNRCQKGVVSESQLPSVSNVPPKCRDVGSAPKVTVRRSARDGRGAARHFQDPYIWVALGKRRSTVNLRPPPLDPSVSCNGIGETSC